MEKKRRAGGLAAVWLCALLCACGPAPLAPLATDARILAFGDSLTEGVGASAEQSYPAVLQALTGLEVVNAGVSGETTDEGLARFASVLDAARPDLVLLIEGGNDILRNRRPARIKANLSAMIAKARDRGIPLVLFGVPAKSLFSNAAPLYDELAEELTGAPDSEGRSATPVVYDGDLIATLLRRSAYKSDLVHFNAEGYRAMAESIHEILIDAGAL